MTHSPRRIFDCLPKRPLRRFRRSAFRTLLQGVEPLEKRWLLASDWTNVLQPLNVKGDEQQSVTPLDVLMVINEINDPKIRESNASPLPPIGANGKAPPPYLDVDCDNFVTPLDVLTIINAINSKNFGTTWRFSQSGGGTSTSGRVSASSCSPKMQEGDSFVTSLVTDLEIPEGSNALAFEYSSLNFDRSSQGRAKDAFEAALLDETGRSLVRTLSPDRDSYWNSTEGFGALSTNDATAVGNKVSLSLVDVLPGTKARLVLRLVNNDSDQLTSVVVSKVVIEKGANLRSSQFTANDALPFNPTSAAIGPQSTSPSATQQTTTSSSNAVPGKSTHTTVPGDGSLIGASHQQATIFQGTPPAALGPLDSRGTEFWIGFPDNLFEGSIAPKKSLSITGDVATTGIVEIPGLLDPATSLPFRTPFVVNPGEVTNIDLPSNDVSDDGNDNETDFDIEAEAVSRVQHKGVHIVAMDQVTVYGVNRAVNTSDAFLALPVDSLGRDYLNLGYGNSFASISHVEGTQLLVVASEDDTKVTIGPGRYTGATSQSNVSVKRPSGTSTFNWQNTDGSDIGPLVTDVAGTHSVSIQAPYDGYAGKFQFQLVDVKTSAVNANLNENIFVHFDTGREAKVVGLDIVSGQLLYYDAINPSPTPNARVFLISPSGQQRSLDSDVDYNVQANEFGVSPFAETGKYYVVIIGEQDVAFDFQFRILDLSLAPILSSGTIAEEIVSPAGSASVYRFVGTAGQALYYDSLDSNRLVQVTIYGPGGQSVASLNAADEQTLTLPETATYYVVANASSFGQPKFRFRLLDLQSLPILPLSVSTVVDIADGKTSAVKFAGKAAQTFRFEISNPPNFGLSYRLVDAAGNDVPLGGNGIVVTAKLLTDCDYVLLIGPNSSASNGRVTILPSTLADPVVAKSGFNSTQTLTIAPGGNATYQFTAPAGTRVIVDGLDVVSENLYVELNAPDGTRLYTGFGFASELQDIPRFDPATLPQSGIYTLTLRGVSSSDSGSYRFRVLDLETFASSIALGSVVSSSFPTGSEVQVFGFDAKAGDQLLFDGIAGAFAFGIYDPFLNVTYSRGINGAAGTNDVDNTLRILRSGRHYAVFHGDPSLPSTFSFFLQNLSTAPHLPFGVEATGSLNPNRQTAYQLDLTAGQRIRVDGMLPFADGVVHVIGNAGGRVLFGSGGNDSGPPDNPFVVVPESGKYYYYVQNRSSNAANYRFRIDDLSAAPELAFDTDTQVTLNPGRAATVFRFDALEGETLQIDNLGASALSLDWRVTGPTNQFRGGSNIGLDFTANALSSGTHYLTLSGESDAGPITIRFRATRTPAPVVPLSGFNTNVNLDIGINETSTYHFDAPVGRIVYLNVVQSRFAIPDQTVSLNRGDTYLVRDLAPVSFSGTPDLTGTSITSTKPIAVFGGNRAAFVPSQFFAADHLVEQLPPTNTWGRAFATMPLVTGSTRGDLFRFLAQSDNTEIKLNGNVIGTINRGAFLEQIIVGPAFIQSSLPILVAQFSQSQQYYRADPGGNPNFLGDPFMMLVPPYEQFLSNYTVSTPAESAIPVGERFVNNYVNIVAPAEAVGFIELNKVAIGAEKFAAIGNSGFFGAQLPIDPGTYQLDGPLPFGAFVYGFSAFDSYGYVGGQALSRVTQVRSVSLSPEKGNPIVGKTIHFAARVADAAGSPLQGIRVDFDVAGVNPKRAFGFSDSNGLVSFQYTGANAGRDVVTASVGQILDDSIVDWRTGATAPQVSLFAPLNGSSIDAGTTLVASGFALADFPLATLDLVTVNDIPISNVDAAGNFFVQLFVGPGENEYVFVALDSNGNTGVQTIKIIGTQRDASKIDFKQFADVTGSFQTNYARSSFNQATGSLLVETAIENIGQFPTDVPLLVGITNISDPSVLVRNASGQTPDGVPFYDFTGFVTNGTLAPHAKSGLLTAEFYNPNKARFTYDLIYFGKLNQPPQIQSLPPTDAYLGREYRYDMFASDPNQEAISFELTESPTGMTINATSGEIRWTPSVNDIGLHSIAIRVSDGRRGESVQRYTLAARSAPANRPPVYSSLPITEVEVDSVYSYLVQAIDPDGDAITFRLASAPFGVTIDPQTGTMRWTPTALQLGLQSIVVEASDSQGGSAEQSFQLVVHSPADNSPPVIVSSLPSAITLAGLQFQVIALDADNNTLSYRLLDSPDGMKLNANGLLEWKPNASQLGAHVVTLEVFDSLGGDARESYNLSVFDNQPPVFLSQPNTSANVNASYTYALSVSDSPDDLLSFRLIDAPTGMTINPSSGLIRWDVAKSAFEQEPVTVTVSDGRGGTATQRFVVHVDGGQNQLLNSVPVVLSVPPTTASVNSKLLYRVQARDSDGDILAFDLPNGPKGMVIDSTTGVLGWLPKSNQVGTHQVVVRVQDGKGGVQLQSFQIEVDATNTAPTITSIPISNATVGVPWEYRIHAQDADHDALRIELGSTFPSMSVKSMIGSDATAILSLKPEAAGSNEVVIVVSDSRGGRSEQRFVLNVAQNSANLAPTIQSQPRKSIAIGEDWVYIVSADDADGEPVVISLATAPAGMSFDPDTRIARWTPTSSQMGSSTALLRVADARGAIAEQRFTLDVVSQLERNAPRIISPPTAFRATIGELFQYQLEAADDDGDPVEWRIIESPHGASLDSRYGTLRWTPASDQLGLQRFTIAATDPSGLPAFQSFSLNVSAVNLGPRILSTALTEAVAEERYVYGVWAVDPENDSLIYSLEAAPRGMTMDSSRGIIRWVPDLSQLGVADVIVSVSDSRGNTSRQPFQIHISQTVRNPTPIITSRAIFRARVDAVYQYDVNAIDPNGETITYSLLSAPAGMVIDASSGMISWTPTIAQAGSQLVQVAAQDTAGGVSVQRFAVLTRLNQAPSISSNPITSIAFGATYHYDVKATDPDGDALNYTLVSAPEGMTIDASGRILWQTDARTASSSSVSVRVTDSFGAAAAQLFDVAVLPDKNPPRVTIQLSANPIAIGENSVAIVQASDDVGVTEIRLLLNGQSVVLDTNRSATFAGNVPGIFALLASAKDTSGNESTTTVQLRVFDPADTSGPTITVNTPTPNSKISTLTQIVGSVSDNNLQFYRVEYARADLVDPNLPDDSDADFVTIARDTSNAVDKVLANFDPTMLVNDDYVVRIIAQDLSGNVSTKWIPLSLEGNLKLGEYDFSTTDLVVPVSGIPISITRSYNTRRANETGDFGYGWSLQLQEAKIRESIAVNPLEEQGLYFAATPFREGTRVYMTNPEGRRVGFTFRPSFQFNLFGGGSYSPVFVPDAGVYDKLDVGSVPLRKINGAFFEALAGSPFNPNDYRLTTKEGTTYEYNQFSGLANVHDRSGNRLEFRSDGVFASNGQSVRFVRDPQGRITRIIDPEGNSLQYRYNLDGELIQFTDQAALTREYSYLASPKHFLLSIVDQDGKESFRANFDSDGRLISSSNALGATLRNAFDTEHLIETTTDPLGNATSVYFDVRGNIIRSVGPTGGVILMQYDSNDNLLRSTDEAGNSVTNTYDTQGNLTSITDPLGAKYTSTFNDLGQATSTVDPLGRTVQYVYDANGKLIRFVNAVGVVTSSTYDEQGRATSLTDGNGNQTILTYGVGSRATSIQYAGNTNSHLPHPEQKFEYNANGQLTKQTDENGNSTSYTYDAIGRPVFTTDPLGATYQYSYSGSLLVQGTDPLGRTTRLEYDGLGRKIREFNPAGGMKQVAYDANNQITSTTDELGRTTKFTFRSDGRVASEEDPAGNITRYEYDAVGHRTAVVDALGNRWLYQYDALGRLLKETDPLGASIVYEYDLVGNKTSTTDARGFTTRNLYDNLNRLIATIDPLGNRSSVQYDNNGQPAAVTDPAGGVTRYEYDDRNRLVRIIDPLGFASEQAFDAAGNKISVTNQVGDTIKFQYDAANHGIGTVDSKGMSTTRVLDAMGNTIRFVDELGQASSYELDALNRVISTSTTDGRIHRIRYDAVGNEVAFVDALGNVTRTEFDSQNHVTRQIDPLGKTTSYSYDAVGNLSKKVDRNGREIDFRYDAARRLILEKWVDGSSVVNTIESTYDASGNRLGIQDRSSKLAFSYDASGHVVSQESEEGVGTPRFVMNSHLDSRGNLTGVDDNFGGVYRTAFDLRNLPRSSSLSGTGIDPIRVDFGYDAKGVRTSATHYRDLTGNNPVGRTQWKYNPQGELAELTHLNAVDAVLADYRYSYNAKFQVRQSADLAGVSQFTYDSAGQLISSGSAVGPSETFQYDRAGNRIQSGNVIGPGNRLIKDHDYRYTYDSEGNLIAKVSLISNDVESFQYDYRNRMTRIEKRDSSGALVSVINYSYDALDRRILVEHDGTITATVYLGNAPWADFDGAGNVTARYLPSEKTDELIARYMPGQGVIWYLSDRVGSVRDLMNNEGTIVDHIDYGSFGNVLSESNPSIGDRFKFTGRELDASSGLYYYRARYYDATTGRFVSEDPMSFAAGDANLHRYVGNDPLNATDPSGKQGMTEADGLAAFVSVYANYALTYGADVPFTYRIGCKAGACGIEGSADGNNSSLGGVPIPKSKNLYSAGLSAGSPGWSGSIGVTAPLLGGWLQVSGSVSLNNEGMFNETIGIGGPFSPTFGTEKAKLPPIPNLPGDAEFSFLVKSTATSPHLLISGDLAIFVGVAQLLSLISEAVVADDLVTAVQVAFQEKRDNPKAAVKASGFAIIPPRDYPTPNESTGHTGGTSNPHHDPTRTHTNEEGDDDEEDDDNDDDSNDGDGSDDASESGDGSLAAIGDFVWSDGNKDGVQDLLELGVANVMVRLFSPGSDGAIGGGDDSLIASQLTDAFGFYLFSSLQPGQYYVRFDVSTLPAGFVPTVRNVGNDDRDSDADNLGFDSITTLGPGEVDLTHDMGIRPAGN